MFCHGVFSGNALERLQSSSAIDMVVFTNTCDKSYNVKEPLTLGDHDNITVSQLADYPKFYMIDITKVTFEKHGLGVGIFNMQGFERRNKEPKEVMRKHGNNKGNILVSNMGRLRDKFERGNFTGNTV